MSFSKYEVSLTTLSTLALSPRDHQGYYRAAGDFKGKLQLDVAERQEDDVDKIKIIYPFYQYGTYNGYNPSETRYYIPGSSLKGALNVGEPSFRPPFKVDDIPIDSNQVSLKGLYKLQHIKYGQANEGDEADKGKVDDFFQNVKVEMMKADETCKGEFFMKGDPGQWLYRAQGNARERLKQFSDRLNAVSNQVKHEESRLTVQQVLDNVRALIQQMERERDNQVVILLGGYKGLALSGLFTSNDWKSGIFVDKNKNLPHGLVQLNWS